METKQKVYLDENNKLVVITDNAVIDSYNKATTSLDGEFTISAGDVARLLSMINECNIKGFNTCCLYKEIYFIANESDYTDTIEDQEKRIKGLRDGIDEMRKDRDKYLIENRAMGIAIDKFNKSRYFWERKLNIEE